MGCFAIAITLLVLDVKVPRALDGNRTLGSALVAMWPSYLAFVTSFATILIMWINHHRMFTLIGRADHRLMFYNGLLFARRDDCAVSDGARSRVSAA